VQAIDTLIGDITPPAELMKTQTDRKIAEEEKKTYETQEAAQRQRQELVKATALANIQQQLVDADQGVRIAELTHNPRFALPLARPSPPGSAPTAKPTRFAPRATPRPKPIAPASRRSARRVIR